MINGEYKKAVEIKVFQCLPEESKKIREEVFVIEQGFEEEFDTVDNYAVHFVAYDETGRPIGTCRIFKEDDESLYYLGRLAVIRELRSMNVGSALVFEAEGAARARGATVMKLHAQCRAAKFYEKCGYLQYGDVEYEEGCPHIWMSKDLY